jgi:hypothetical protein
LSGILGLREIRGGKKGGGREGGGAGGDGGGGRGGRDGDVLHRQTPHLECQMNNTIAITA